MGKLEAYLINNNLTIRFLSSGRYEVCNKDKQVIATGCSRSVAILKAMDITQCFCKGCWK